MNKKKEEEEQNTKSPSPEGVNSTLAAIAIFWGVLLGYSVAVSRICWDTAWYAMFVHYLGTLACFYAWHWQAHRRVKWVPFNSACVKLHMKHHWGIYPPEHFFGADESKGLVESHSSFVTQHEALLYVLLGLQLVVARLVFAQSWSALLAALLQGVVIGYVGNYLHQSFHIKGHWFERFPAFHYLRSVHYVHHLGSTKMNYAVFNIGLDWLMGSLLLAEPETGKEREQIEATSQELASHVGGLVTMTLGLQSVPRNVKTLPASAWQRGFFHIVVRCFIIVGMTYAWFVSQSYLHRASADQLAVPLANYPDLLHSWIPETGRPGLWLDFLGVSLDLMTAAVFLCALTGDSVRPLLHLLYSFGFRQLISMLGAHSNPAQSHWGDPHSYASFFVSFRLCEHTLPSGIFSVTAFIAEVSRFIPQKNIKRLVALLLLSSYIYALITLRAEWSPDLLISLLVSRYTFLVANCHTPFIERLLP